MKLLRVFLQLWLCTTLCKLFHIRYIGIGLGNVGVISSFFYDSVASGTDAQNRNTVTTEYNFVHTVFYWLSVIFPADCTNHITIEGIDFFALSCCDYIHTDWIDWNDFRISLCYHVFIGTWFSFYSHLALFSGKSTISMALTCNAVVSFFFRSVQGVISKLKVCLRYSYFNSFLILTLSHSPNFLSLPLQHYSQVN